MVIRNKLSRSITYLIVIELHFSNPNDNEFRWNTNPKVQNHVDSVRLSMQNVLFVCLLISHLALRDLNKFKIKVNLTKADRMEKNLIQSVIKARSFYFHSLLVSSQSTC